MKAGSRPAAGRAVLVDDIRAAHARAAPWPYAELDVAALRAAGHAPVPFRELVLKVHQRCNLACDYCYVYELADQSWRDRPRTMSDAVRDAALARFAGHARRHRLSGVRIVLHGGEPLLYGPAELARLVRAARDVFPPGCRVEFSMQTNGVLLDAPTVAVLVEQGISVGVSVDGTPADHDRHRRTRTGRGSFAAVARGLQLLRRPENRAAYAGLLCTVDPGTDPIACYEQLLTFDPPAIDLLLPHLNWEHPPTRPPGATPYAGWLIAVFDRWYADRSPVRIRLFDDTISLVLGGDSRSEQIGLSPSGVLVVESDGAIEQVDALKSAYPGACATGLNVIRDELDAALDDPGIVARQIGRAALSDECQACPAVAFCGGGHYAHRYRPGVGFRAPSVHCADMRAFIRHVYDRVASDVG
ncbi:FxsB family cyclophane-forming radical SAM/SPASM peptide maturase [Actinoplanes aureus]|uniref:FxsB family radical SAM/SPASM domain protein n=1 Tax=Actinoplanes aureus TaxID=2792083 RepID=A0A931C8F6_9ACTN|nr:FxsB family cyclophane-forming radical SAM/SPASM peptide maturase [Actinoplanes aureus]MBG0564109.1 FxsB family radical SAM/SPASM domain protein [Actinoplanes aureus]